MSTIGNERAQVSGHSPSSFAAQNEIEEELDFGEYFAVLLNAKWFIASITTAGLLAGWFYAFISEPLYQSDSLVQVEESRQGLSSLEDANAMLFGSETALSAEIEILKSRLVLGQVVDEQRLDVEAKPRWFPIIGQAIAREFEKKSKAVAAPWFGQEKYAWGGEIIELETLEVPEELKERWLTLVVQKSGRYQIRIGDGAVLGEGTVGVRTEIPIQDAGTLSLFVAHLKAREGTEFLIVRHDRMNSIGRLLSSLGVTERGRQSKVLELTMTGGDPKQLRDNLNALANVYLRQNVERRSAEAEKTLIFLDKQLPALKAQLDASTNALNAYRMEKGSLDLNKETQDVLEKVVTLEAELISIKQRREEARQKYKPEHPQIRALDAQILNLEQELTSQDQKVHKLPETQQVVLRLSRDVEVSSTVYTSLLNSAQELRIAKAGTIGNVRIIDYAVTSGAPIRPKKLIILSASGLTALLMACIMTFSWRGLRRGIEDPDVIERQLHLPVYAVIPLSETQAKLTKQFKRKSEELAAGEVKPLVLAFDNPEDIAIESLRSLRTTIHFAMFETKNNIILVTGSRPGVGKTFLIVNMAVVLAQSGNRILVIDADMRRGYVNRFFGIDRSGGLSEWLSSKEENEHPTIQKIGDVDIITTGEIPPNPSELLLHKKFATLLDVMKERYDYVLIDTPPILAVTDAAIIGRIVGISLMVIQAGIHPVRELQQAVKRMEHAGAHIRGFILNKVPLVHGKYSDGYGYGYGKYVYQYNYSRDKNKVVRPKSKALNS